MRMTYRIKDNNIFKLNRALEKYHGSVQRIKILPSLSFIWSLGQSTTSSSFTSCTISAVSKNFRSRLGGSSACYFRTIGTFCCHNNKFLNVTRKWYQYFINIELIGSIVACFTKRYDIRVVVKPIYLFYMCTNKIASSELMTICSRTSPCGFSAFLFPVLQPRFITCWGIIAAGSA